MNGRSMQRSPAKQSLSRTTKMLLGMLCTCYRKTCWAKSLKCLLLLTTSLSLSLSLSSNFADFRGFKKPLSRTHSLAVVTGFASCVSHTCEQSTPTAQYHLIKFHTCRERPYHTRTHVHHLTYGSCKCLQLSTVAIFNRFTLSENTLWHLPLLLGPT